MCPSPVSRFLPDLIKRIQAGRIHPGKGFTSSIALDDTAEVYQAMDERREIRVVLEGHSALLAGVAEQLGG